MPKYTSPSLWMRQEFCDTANERFGAPAWIVPNREEYQDLELPDSIECTYAEYMEFEIAAVKILSERLHAKFGKGVFRVFSFREESKEANVIRVTVSLE